MKNSNLCIEQVSNGYILSTINDYGSKGEGHFSPTIGDLVIELATRFKEKEFAETVKQSAGFVQAFQMFCESIVAPKFAAIETRLNPGLENVTDDQLKF